MASLIVLVCSFAVLRLLGLEVGTLDGWQPTLHEVLAVNVYESIVVLTG